MRYDANTQRWEEFEIKGTKGLFCGMRINRDTIPPQYHMYEIADECDGIPCRYDKRILVNFYGTFVTDVALDVADPYGYGHIEDDNYSFIGGIYDNFEDAIKWLEGKEDEVRDGQDKAEPVSG